MQLPEATRVPLWEANILAQPENKNTKSSQLLMVELFSLKKNISSPTWKK